MITKQSELRNTPEQDCSDLIMQDCYDEAIVLAKRKLKQLPRRAFARHWYLAHLCSAYYEKKKYKTALKWGKEAFKSKPECPSVLWHLASPLYMLGNLEEAILCYRSIMERGLDRLAYGECGEGKEYALRLRSDCRYCLIHCYVESKDFKNAVKWAKLFLRYYCPGGCHSNIKDQKFAKGVMCGKKVK